MNYIRNVTVFCLLLVTGTVTFSQEISPMLVGVNVWYIDPSQQVWDLTKQSGVTSMRIGGHAYDDNIPSRNQLKDWVTRIQAMGAEPIMQVSQYDTPAEAADLVKYFNIDLATGKAVKYWNIGNEPWLQNGRPAISTVGAMVEAYFKPISVSMKEVDPAIKIYGPDFCYFIGEAIDDLYGGENDIAGKIPGKDYYYSDGISWHRYPQDDNINLAYEGIEDFKGSIIACKAKVDEVNTAYNRTGDDALGWGIGEFNAKGGAVVHTWENGQMYGGVLDLCMKYGATYATSWSMFENGGSRQGTDFSFIDGANMTPRANYRHMEMISKYFKGTYKTGTSSLSDIIVFGSRDADTISVMIMNRAAAPVNYSLFLNSSGSAGSEVNLNVDADSEKVHLDLIAGKATQLLVFKNDEIFKINYSSLHFDNELAPDESFVLNAMFPPAAPSSLSSVNPTYNSVDLEWQFGENDTINGFLIERKKESDTDFILVGMVDNSSTTFTDKNLAALTTYIYRIRAYNSAGYSGFSNEISATTPDVPAKVAFNGPHTIPGRIQVEDYNNNDEGIGYHDSEPANQGGAYRPAQGVDIENCTDEGGGYSVGYVEDGEWLEYLVEDIEEGTYDIALRLASNNETDSKKVRVYLNNTLLATFTPVFTGGWQTWKTVVIEDVEISGGENQLLKLLFGGSSFNLNWIETGTGLSSRAGEYAEKMIHRYYSSETGSIIIHSDDQIDAVNISLHDTLGRQHLRLTEHNFTSGSYPVTLPGGLYFLSLNTGKVNLTDKMLIL